MTITSDRKPLILTCVYALTIFLYAQGLPGSFVFDDFYNLNKLENIVFDEPSSYFNFIFSLDSGPLARPISAISFGLNYSSWPHYPEYFKLFNISIHLLLTVIIFISLKLLLIRYVDMPSPKAEHISLIVTIIWAIHPINVSTVLYSVQRMAQLSSLFSLLSIYIYTKYLLIHKWNEQRSFRALLLPSIAFFLLATSAVLSKESGLTLFIVLFMLHLLYEESNHHFKHKNNAYVIVYWLLVKIPFFVIVVAYVIYMANYADSAKGFSAHERGLTQLRILIIYIKQIIFPNYTDMGLYVSDQISISKSLIEPVTTLFSLIAIISVTVYAFLKQNKMYKFALFWFFGFHFIESTIIPLDLYYEHRNYLASLGVILLLVSILYKFKNNLKYLIVAVLILFSLQTFILSTAWSDRIKMVNHYLTHNPDSPLVVLDAIQTYESEYGQVKASILLEQVTAYNEELSEDFELKVIKYTYECILGYDSRLNTLNETKSLIKPNFYIASNNTSSILRLTTHIANQRCIPSNTEHLTIQEIIDLVSKYARQRNDPIWLSSMKLEKARLYSSQNKTLDELENLIQAYDILPNEAHLIRLLFFLDENEMETLLLNWLSETNDLKRFNEQDKKYILFLHRKYASKAKLDFNE